jgi:glycosyltransferase involved in cell wall biosynthesis
VSARGATKLPTWARLLDRTNCQTTMPGEVELSRAATFPMRKRIAFILPATAPAPIGGAKNVYRYADGLAAMGHRVTLVHPEASILRSFRLRADTDDELSNSNAFGVTPHIAVAKTMPGASLDPHPWYRSRPDVINLVVPDLSEDRLGGPYDFTIVNNRLTVPLVEAYSPQMGRKIYFMQDYESYMLGSPAEREVARRTLNTDWPIICTSLAGLHLAESASGRACQFVRNAVDTRRFYPHAPIESNDRNLIGFPARTERTKRTIDAIRAVGMVRSSTPSHIRFWCFGYEPVPALPAWVDHYIAPDDDQLIELYNRSMLFIVPSEHEGFGMPGAEAMACGVALISTSNGGVNTYAMDGVSAILCPPGDPASIASAIRRLIENEDQRVRLANAGAVAVARWRLSDAIEHFERALLSEAGR